MAVLQLSLPSPSSSTLNSLLTLKTLTPNSSRVTLQSRFPPKPSFKALNSVKPSSSPIKSLQPFIRSQWIPILKGWSCSLLSVYALSQSVPRIGHFSTGGLSDVARLKDEGLVLAVLFLVRLVSSYGQQVYLWDAALNSVYRIRVYVFQAVLRRDLELFEGAGSIMGGDIAHRITAEAMHSANAVYALLNVMVPSTLHLVAMITQMLVISPAISLISALVIPCMALIIAHLGKRLRKISRKAQISIANTSVYLNEVFSSILFVKANSLEMSESARFQRLARDDLSASLKKRKLKSLIPQIVQLVYFGSLSILCVCSLVVSRGSISGSSIVSFVTSLVFIVEPIQGVEKAYNDWKEAEPAIERLFDLTRFKIKVIEKPDAVDLDCIRGELKFCDISFRYGDSMPLVLDGLDLHIAAGETVAFVGPSGGGKTTLVKLLLRLYDPLHGQILLDNYNIQSIRFESLRRHIGLVAQDIILFTGTVAENIGYRDLMGKIDMERVELAAHTANIDEFIRSLPQGYETYIGPRGSTLSGGQKQRLAIARALYQQSSILILDEATSALDSQSELLVRRALERVVKDHTVLVIAHRLETVLMANRVFLLKDGKAEELNRTSLLERPHGSSLETGLVV